MISKIRPWLKLTAVVIALSWYLGILLMVSAVKGKNIQRGFRYRSKFCKTATIILGIEYHHGETSHPQVCLYVSNHRSMLDPLLQLGYLNAFIVSKSEVAHYPLLGRGAKETGIILVDRNDQGSRKSALSAIEVTLRSGYSVLLYPEGTTHGGELTGEFRRGAFELAYRLDIPIVPVMIDYPDSSYFWVNGSLLRYFEKVFSSGKKLEVKGETGDEIRNGEPEKLLQLTQSKINSMIIESRSL